MIVYILLKMFVFTDELEIGDGGSGAGMLRSEAN